MITSLPISDVEQIVHLLGTVSDPRLDLTLPDRKRMLAKGIMNLVDADVYIWSTGVISSDSGIDIGRTSVIDGGWSSAMQKRIILEVITDPNFTTSTLRPILQLADGRRMLTRRREEFLDEATWEIVGERWRRAGLNHFIATFYPLALPAYSGVSFLRVGGKPPFSDRDEAIVNVILGQVDWLHRHGMNSPAGGVVLNLSPRERQVLLLLLQGNSIVDAARYLAISRHTVGDYVKKIYKHFSVSSHAELQAIFLIGNDTSEKLIGAASN